jgi:hypothetical protein
MGFKIVSVNDKLGDWRDNERRRRPSVLVLHSGRGRVLIKSVCKVSVRGVTAQTFKTGHRRGDG